MAQTKEKKHPHGGHRQRVKDKARKAGIEHWPAHEVLELMLMYCIPYRDVNPLAHELIERFGSISGVLDAGVNELQRVNGISKEGALFLTLLPEFFAKYVASKATNRIQLDTPLKCVNHFREIYDVKHLEDFYVFCLDKDKYLLKTIFIHSDFTSSVTFPIKNFVTEINFKECHSLVIMHTHPSGNPNPTQADMTATKRLISSAYNVGVNIDDHLIMANDKYCSFLKNDWIKNLYNEVVNGIPSTITLQLTNTSDE